LVTAPSLLQRPKIFCNRTSQNDTECVISDVQMPGLSGVGLQSQLIADGNRTPIIFTTASHAVADPCDGPITPAANNCPTDGC
jgi:FixJ family two-component response regulator